MCTASPHTCYCGAIYSCDDPNWLCPTVNEDEDGFLCPVCYGNMVAELERFYYKEDPSE